MKTLYLLRHAHSLPAAPRLMGDYERILSPQGIEESRLIGRFMQERGICPEFVLSSSSVRTIQTAQFIFGTLFSKVGLKVSSHFDRHLYQASAQTLLSEIKKTDSTINHLLVVAHNPGVADLAMTLGDVQDYAPATLTIFKAECQNWSEFSPDDVQLEQVFSPAAGAF
ncbi:MAG: histidine phosphatase family protein [Proteobacteria bacterium]|nr:histidine phosphatase family protein [Pseudomonadota bacterium]